MANSMGSGGSGAGKVAVGVRDVSHAFPLPGGGVKSVLEHIELSVAQGEFVAIVGPSGCGKTTLMNLAAGLEPVQTGSVEVLGCSPRSGRRDVGYLFARDALLPWRSVLGNAELALELAGVEKAERQERARALLAQVGLEGVAKAFPAELSQGMRQRVAIARTLAATPSLLMLDEPFSALDAQTKLLLQDAFSQLWQGLGSTVILITHDLAEAVALADRVVLMTAGPGRIKRVFRVDLARPRSIVDLQGDPGFHHIYEQLWSELREEVTR